MPDANTRAPGPPIQVSQVIRVEGVSKVYGAGPVRTEALRDVTLSVERGARVALTGRSGSGKSTLLNLVTGIDRPTRGNVFIDGTSPVGMSERELARWRGRTVGVVFQFFQLLPTLTILENVVLPMDLCGVHPKELRRQRALALLERVGIADQATKFPSALSGGQQQRAAIARALANDPPVLVADEPTGNLDSRTGEAIFELFSELSAAGTTVLVVTHETELATRFDRTIELEDGVVVRADRSREHPEHRDHSDHRDDRNHRVGTARA